MDRRALFLAITLALVLDGLAGMAGGLLPERVVARRAPALVGFAAGALISAVFLDVLPEALDALGPGALRWTLLAFVLFALLEWSLGHHRHERAEQRGAARPGTLLPTLLLSSDAFHNISDGAAIAAAFLTSPRTGVVTALAVIVHEVPEEIGDYALLRASGISQWRALLLLALVQLTAVLGALAVFLASAHVERLSGLVLALAGGSFLYIGATDLLPEIHTGRDRAQRTERLAGFLVGTSLILLAKMV